MPEKPHLRPISSAPFELEVGSQPTQGQRRRAAPSAAPVAASRRPAKASPAASAPTATRDEVRRRSGTPGTPGTPDRSDPLRLPKYRLHKPTGRAVVTIAGRDHYLGSYGTAESRGLYDRVVSEWMASGRPVRVIAAGPTLTVSELVLAYWGHVKSVYAKPTTRGTVAPTLRRLRRLYGTLPVRDFGPRSLRALQESMVQEVLPDGRRLSRRYINRSVGWVKRCFKWGVAEEIVPVDIFHALQAVEALRYGRTNAPEKAPIGPVPDSAVDAVLPLLSEVVADMVRLQRLTGMRPGEVCQMRIGEIDTTERVWVFRPRHHKNAHRGHARAVPIGPRAQRILKGYLRAELESFVFTPAQATLQRFERMRAQRRTPLTPSQRARDRKHADRRTQGFRECYSTQAYALAIWRACDAAGIPRWSPNRLRHTRATELRRQFGLDTASAVLGHSKIETTQIYAERNLDLAVQAALKTG